MLNNVVYVLQTRDGFRVASHIDVDSIYYDPMADIFENESGSCDSGNFCEDELWKCFEDAFFFEAEQEAIEYANELAMASGDSIYNIFYLRYPDLDFPTEAIAYSDDTEDGNYAEELNFNDDEDLV